jgi:NAD dependent epimerase/dehydratase family enzyme
VIGGHEPDVPGYWRLSVDIATSWEDVLRSAPTPRTRKVASRAAFTMNPERGSVFDWFVWLARTGLGGPLDGGAAARVVDPP